MERIALPMPTDFSVEESDYPDKTIYVVNYKGIEIYTIILNLFGQGGPEIQLSCSSRKSITHTCAGGNDLFEQIAGPTDIFKYLKFYLVKHKNGNIEIEIKFSYNKCEYVSSLGVLYDFNEFVTWLENPVSLYSYGCNYISKKEFICEVIDSFFNMYLNFRNFGDLSNNPNGIMDDIVDNIPNDIDSWGFNFSWWKCFIKYICETYTDECANGFIFHYLLDKYPYQTIIATKQYKNESETN